MFVNVSDKKPWDLGKIDDMINTHGLAICKLVYTVSLPDNPEALIVRYCTIGRSAFHSPLKLGVDQRPHMAFEISVSFRVTQEMSTKYWDSHVIKLLQQFDDMEFAIPRIEDSKKAAMGIGEYFTVKSFQCDLPGFRKFIQFSPNDETTWRKAMVSCLDKIFRHVHQPILMQLDIDSSKLL